MKKWYGVNVTGDILVKNSKVKPVSYGFTFYENINKCKEHVVKDLEKTLKIHKANVSDYEKRIKSIKDLKL